MVCDREQRAENQKDQKKQSVVAQVQKKNSNLARQKKFLSDLSGKKKITRAWRAFLARKKNPARVDCEKGI